MSKIVPNHKSDLETCEQLHFFVKRRNNTLCLLVAGMVAGLELASCRSGITKVITAKLGACFK